MGRIFLAPLLLLGFLFGGNESHHRICPYPREEKIPIYEKPTSVVTNKNGMITVSYKTDGKVLSLETKEGSTTKGIIWDPGSYLELPAYILSGETTTVDITSGQVLGRITGYKTDTDAVAFNKRVRECETANGEFNN